MANYVSQLKAAIQAGTVFDTGLVSRIEGAIGVATAYATQTGGDVDAHTQGLIKLKDHVVDILDNLPARITAIKAVSGTEVDLNPYIGSFLGRADAIILFENGFLAANAEAAALVDAETASYTAALDDIEAQAYAVELNELLRDPLGSAVLDIVGGPVIQTALDAERQAFIDLYDFDTSEVDDGSVISDDDDDDCPCC